MQVGKTAGVVHLPCALKYVCVVWVYLCTYTYHLVQYAHLFLYKNTDLI